MSLGEMINFEELGLDNSDYSFNERVNRIDDGIKDISKGLKEIDEKIEMIKKGRKFFEKEGN